MLPGRVRASFVATGPTVRAFMPTAMPSEHSAIISSPEAKHPEHTKAQVRRWFCLGWSGADEGTRTPNHLFTRQVRYRLRHVGEVPTYGRSRSRGSRRNVVPEERPETVDGGSRTSPADSGTSGQKGR